MSVPKRTIKHPSKQIRKVSSRNTRILQSHNKIILWTFKNFFGTGCGFGSPRFRASTVAVEGRSQASLKKEQSFRRCIDTRAERRGDPLTRLSGEQLPVTGRTSVVTSHSMSGRRENRQLSVPIFKRLARHRSSFLCKPH